MEQYAIIPTEKLESLQADIAEIKGLLHDKKNQAELNKWLLKKEARLRLKVCNKTFDNYLAKGILPHSRFAGKIYIKASDIEAHLERHYIKQ